ncbi:MAG TPA: glycoside hydrolase family 2 TIM barrel-domain containing protein [Pyrinomonadaceae bacterium]|nr:glycoside hydrolase family 2 TIM barrel-domain containing protein [Pyrinomonadaceae bacterium]
MKRFLGSAPIWSAVTCHRFILRLTQSADESAHSILGHYRFLECLSTLVICLLCAAFISVSTSFAQTPAPLIQNAANRKTISLNGDWHFIVDPHEEGTARRYYLNGKPYGSRDFVEYDFNTAPTLRVPGDWNFQRAELQMYEGTLWYQRTFDYHLQANRRVFVYFGAANYRARVWLNDKPLCEHEGGFTPFNCEATPILQEGANVIIVSVNDTRHADDIPSLRPDWFNYGGLTRDVMLVAVPRDFIQQYSVQLDRSPARRLSGWVRTTGESSNSNKATIRIPELGLSAEATADKDGLLRFSFPAPTLELWSPEKPKLYRVEIVTPTDQIIDEIGFRTIETRGTDILLNGRSIFLRGIDMHEEPVGRPGRAHGEEDARKLLGLAKELGCNFVRLAHYPHDETMVRSADRLGLMVWSEVPVYQGIDFKNAQTLAKATQQLTEMITRDRNRAAIVLWSVSNETPKSAERNAFLQELIRTARSLDPTRLITTATNQTNSTEPHKKVFDDPIIADLDVFGVNEYIGWYEGVPADLDITAWATPYNKPMIVSEFGGEAKYGLHGTLSKRWTEENQEEIYLHQIAALRKIPFLRGTSPWILKDFRSPHRNLPGLQDGFNRKGLVSENGERKKAFFVLQKFYHEMAKQNGATGL